MDPNATMAIILDETMLDAERLEAGINLLGWLLRGGKVDDIHECYRVSLALRLLDQSLDNLEEYVYA